MSYPKLHIIHDCRRSEKYEPLIKELERQRIFDYEVYPCIILPDVVESISESHKMIVRKAKDEGRPFVIIGEDDLYFPNENGFKYFLDNMPPLFDIYTSANYQAFKKPEHHGAFKVDSIVGFQLYIVHSRYYKTFLATNPKKHIDCEQRSPLMYCTYPFPALQRKGWSANNKMEVNYNAILQPEDIYT